ncbi:hypothetical protein F2Q69_00027599 [Brassica cretica]|uniref:Uncharacterized protein n=1 Tax=Brassica cretica TaxID=69181 RepID=A0A8S9RQE2_BRACR|nr:hypothetical protein F2Q69_00027599 [Brassica cretica]
MRRTTGMQVGKSPRSIKIHGNLSKTPGKDSRATNLNAPTMAIQSRNSLIPFTEVLTFHYQIMLDTASEGNLVQETLRKQSV